MQIMNRYLISGLAVLASAISAYAQGTVALNSVPGPRITLDGVNANPADNIWVQVLVAGASGLTGSGANPFALTLAGANAGSFSKGALTVGGKLGGTTVDLTIRAWDFDTGADYDSATVKATTTFSQLLGGLSADGVFSPPTALSGGFTGLKLVTGVVVTPEPRTNALGTTLLLEGPLGGVDSVVLAIRLPTESWTAVANDSWLHLDPANSQGTGSRNIIFTFDPNPGATRTGSLTLAGLPLNVTQAGASYVPANLNTTLVPKGKDTPVDVALDRAGNIYVGFFSTRPIAKWTATTGVITELPFGEGAAGLDVDRAGNVYFIVPHLGIRKWTAATETISDPFFDVGGLSSVAVDDAGDLYYTDRSFDVVRKWTKYDRKVVTLVSNLNSPHGVAVDQSGNVYFADIFSNSIMKFSPADGTTTALVSTGLLQPQGVAVDGSGNVYFGDVGNQAIKKWTAATRAVTVEVNSGLIFPAGVAVDDSGNIYIADFKSGLTSERSRAFVDPASRTESVNAGNGELPPVLPVTANLQAPQFVPKSDQSWLKIRGVSNGVVSYSFTANATGAPRTANLTVLGQKIAITQAATVAGPVLTGSVRLPDGGFQFGFTGTAGVSYSVRFSTDLALPFSAWTLVGPATITSPGQFQFTAAPPSGGPNGFYRVVSP